MQAATRGDGREGEDVTHNVVTPAAVQGLPVSVPATALNTAMPAEFEVRGEIYIKSEDFLKVCWQKSSTQECKVLQACMTPTQSA